MGFPKRTIDPLISENGICFLLNEDYRTHQSDWSLPGFRAVASYRVAVWARGLRNPLLRLGLMIISRSMLRYVRNSYGIELSHNARIGRRFHVGHQNGIIIHEYATIGDDCLVRQGVTLGTGGIGRLDAEDYFRKTAPVVGNRVDFGAGAMVVGQVAIGDDVNIGPNAVVLSNVPANTTVLGPISKSIRRAAPDQEPLLVLTSRAAPEQVA